MSAGSLKARSELCDAGASRPSTRWNFLCGSWELVGQCRELRNAECGTREIVCLKKETVVTEY